MDIGLSGFAIILIVVGLILLVSTVKTVQQGYEYTVQRFGKYTKTLSPGLHILMPFVERIGAKVNMQERVLDVPSQEVITKDNAMVRADGVVFFQIIDAARATYEVHNMENAVLNLVMTNLRTVMGSMDLDELLSMRDQINVKLLDVVDEATQPWGVKITRIEIKDIEPPRDIIDAMARQMKAERDKRAQVLEAQGDRAAEILRAEGEKAAAVLDAEGRKEAAFRDAEARERAAEAEAKATDMVSEAIEKGGSQAIGYFIAQKYVETMSDFARSPNSKMIFMPLESSSLIGSLGSMTELLDNIKGSSKVTSTKGSVPKS
jgi:regulator of protease activity HflC (stomatin/prohibitin superfamily)